MYMATVYGYNVKFDKIEFKLSDANTVVSNVDNFKITDEAKAKEGIKAVMSKYPEAEVKVITGNKKDEEKDKKGAQPKANDKPETVKSSKDNAIATALGIGFVLGYLFCVLVYSYYNGNNF